MCNCVATKCGTMQCGCRKADVLCTSACRGCTPQNCKNGHEDAFAAEAQRHLEEERERERQLERETQKERERQSNREKERTKEREQTSERDEAVASEMVSYYAIDAGKGQASVVAWPGGGIVVDTGKKTSTSQYPATIAQIAIDNDADALLVSHSDTDHGGDSFDDVRERIVDSLGDCTVYYHCSTSGVATPDRAAYRREKDYKAAAARLYIRRRLEEAARESGGALEAPSGHSQSKVFATLAKSAGTLFQYRFLCAPQRDADANARDDTKAVDTNDTSTCFVLEKSEGSLEYNTDENIIFKHYLVGICADQRATTFQSMLRDAALMYTPESRPALVYLFDVLSVSHHGAMTKDAVPDVSRCKSTDDFLDVLSASRHSVLARIYLVQGYNRSDTKKKNDDKEMRKTATKAHKNLIRFVAALHYWAPRVWPSLPASFRDSPTIIFTQSPIDAETVVDKGVGGPNDNGVLSNVNVKIMRPMKNPPRRADEPDYARTQGGFVRVAIERGGGAIDKSTRKATVHDNFANDAARREYFNTFMVGGTVWAT